MPVASHPDPKPLLAIEAILVGLAMATGVVLIEVIDALPTGRAYLGALREGAALRIWGAYALVFGALGLAGWLFAMLVRRFAATSRTIDTFLVIGALSIPIVGSFRVVGSRLWAHGPVREFLLGGSGIATALGSLVILAGLTGFLLRRGYRRLLSFVAVAGLIALAGALGHTRRELPADLLEAAGLLSLGKMVLAACIVALPVAWALGNVHRRPVPRRLGIAVVGMLAAFMVVVFAIPPGFYYAAPVLGDPPDQDRTSVLFIVVDTLRADFVSGTGAKPGTTPGIETLVRDGIAFSEARSTAPWTAPSFGSLLSSTYPSQHRAGLRDDATGLRYPFSVSAPSLAQTLLDAGYYTAVVSTNSYLDPQYGLNRGFATYENFSRIVNKHGIANWLARLIQLNTAVYVRAEQQVGRVLQMIDRIESSGRPAFLLAHFMDPHEPYHPMDEFDQLLPEQRVPMYTNEVRYLDHWIGVMLDRLREKGLYDDLLIVLTADHGEELTEERIRPPDSPPHGHNLFEELLRVPLIIKLPKNAGAGTRRTDPVSSIDVAPTILKRLGVAPPHGFLGRDLLDPLDPDDAGKRLIFAEGLMERTEMKTAVLDKAKVILHEQPPAEDAAVGFDLSQDMGERNPIDLSGQPSPFAEILRALLAHIEETANGGATDAPVGVDPATREELEALGYVQ